MQITSLNNSIRYIPITPFCGICNSLRNNFADTVSFTSDTGIKYYNDNRALFKWAERKPIKDFQDISPDNLVLVHMSDYFPEGGKISSVKNATRDENGVSKYRSTVHFALNHVVHEHKYGNRWHSMKYGIILPFKKTLENVDKQDILGGKYNDFFLRGDIELPDGSYIVKYNPDIQDGKIKVSNISQTSEGFDDTKCIRLVETSNPDLSQTVNNVIKKAGYTNFDELIRKGMGIPEEYENLALDEMAQYELLQNNPEKYAEFISAYNSAKKTGLIKFGLRAKKCWKDFCKKYHFSDCMHTYSPWGRSEMLIESIKTIKKYSDDWVHVLKPNEEKDSDTANLFVISSSFYSRFLTKNPTDAQQEESEKTYTIDYQKELIKVIDEIKKQVPPDKPLSYDINKMREIIETSNKPSVALERIEKELKLKVLSDLPEDDEIASPIEIFKILDELMCFSDLHKLAAYQNTVRNHAPQTALKEIGLSFNIIIDALKMIASVSDASLRK